MDSNRMQLVGGAIIAGGAGTITAQSGLIASIAHPGAGTWNITLGDDYAIDAAECVIECQFLAALAGSDGVSFGIVHTSDTVKQITAVQEQAGGGASILADVNFCLVVHRIEPVA